MKHSSFWNISLEWFGFFFTIPDHQNPPKKDSNPSWELLSPSCSCHRSEPPTPPLNHNPPVPLWWCDVSLVTKISKNTQGEGFVRTMKGLSPETKKKSSITPANLATGTLKNNYLSMVKLRMEIIMWIISWFLTGKWFFSLSGVSILTLSKQNCKFGPAKLPQLVQVLQDGGIPHTLQPVQGLFNVKESLVPLEKEKKI